MSSIADALKRAQQERDRLRNQEAGAPAAAPQSDPGEASLASIVLRKTQAADGATDNSSGIPAAPSSAIRPTMTPLADAIRQAPIVPPPAVRAQQQAAETIVEDYASKHRLNLPAAMVVYHERSGAIAEQYRKIRDGLMQANPKRDPQMLVITSSLPGEGKTTTVINLGLSLVEVRANRVLLIDGCLQRPGSSPRKTLTELLRMQAEAGLAELLTDPVEDVQPFIKATPWNRLYFLPAGNHITAMTATDMLKSQVLRQCLRQLRSNFDWVLIDSPPALALPHAGLFGGSSDGMLLALALHHTPQDKVQTTVRKLKSMNLPLKSCILTHA